MRQEVILRALQKSDLGAIEDIIRRAWHYDDLAGPDTARQLAAVFLRSCLKNQTFVRVAAVDGVPVGVIMGRSDRSYRWRLREAAGQAAAILRLLASREGRVVSRIFRSVDSIDRQLLTPRRAMFQGELSFFAGSGYSAAAGKPGGARGVAYLSQCGQHRPAVADPAAGDVSGRAVVFCRAGGLPRPGRGTKAV